MKHGSIFQKLQIALNLAKIGKMKKTIDVYFYSDKHVVIPRYSTGVYGSEMKKLVVEDDKTSFYGKFYVKKNKVMAISRSGQKCIYQ